MPSRLLVKQDNVVHDHPPDQLSELPGEFPCWLDIAVPQSNEMELVASELQLHPLAVEDARNRHQRPKVDEYDDHYFIVVYGLEEPSPDVIEQHELSIFVKHNAIVTVHDGRLAALATVERRFPKARSRRRDCCSTRSSTRSWTATSRSSMDSAIESSSSRRW